MSLSRALSNANSGLAVTSRRADVAASNIANASNPNYVRRQVVTEERVTDGSGNGARIASIEQVQNFELKRQVRDAESALGRTSTIAQAYTDLNSQIGDPGSGFGLFASVENLEASLKALQATPESSAIQNTVVQSAREITGELNRLSESAQVMREQADKNILNDVQKVNQSLYRLQEINEEITGVTFSSGAGGALESERQIILNDISKIIPIKDIQRENGQIDVITDTGVFMLSGNVRELSFTASPVIEDTNRFGEVGSGLSGLFIGEQDVTPGTDGAQKLKSGSLAGEFAVRDKIAPEFTDSIDALAQDIIDRFSNDAIDPTKVPGAQGLFTDATYAADPTQTVGAAGRISLNAAIDPNVGGEIYRIRDGIGATAPGVTGDASIITNMIGALSESRTINYGGGVTGVHDAINATAAFTSQIGEQALRFDSINAGTTVRRDTLNDAALDASGVDTDFELQSLIFIEQSYAANARVIQTVDQMIDRLLQI